jgi:hypothetical protein
LTPASHAAPTGRDGRGVQSGPTIALGRILLHRGRRRGSAIAEFFEGSLFNVGDGSSVRRDTFQIASSLGTVLWAFVALGAAALGILVGSGSMGWPFLEVASTFCWSTAVAACVCGAVWAVRACWWNVRVWLAKNDQIAINASGLTEWLALAAGVLLGAYWAWPS